MLSTSVAKLRQHVMAELICGEPVDQAPEWTDHDRAACHSFKRTRDSSDPLAASVCALLHHAVLHKFPALRADDLLIDRLLQAIEARLRDAELHLILPLLTLQCLRRGLTGKALAGGDRRCGSGVGLD